MTTLKKGLLFALVLVLCLTLTVGATVAYLTDRDSAANIFTVGDVSIKLEEDFEQGTKLIPDVDIEKIPTITNTGKNDAWVWLELAIPAALDNWNPNGQGGSSENVIHWNPLGATTVDFVTEERVANAIAAGYLPEGTTAKAILENNKTWNVFNQLVNGGNAYTTKIKVNNRNLDYNVYVIPYNKALEPGETTLPTLYKVYLDAAVDIDPEGNWYKVVDGDTKNLNWNVKTNGYPVIYVSAYAIQKESFATVEEAYLAYQSQWGENGKEWGTVPTIVSNWREFTNAVNYTGGEIIMDRNIITEGPLNCNRDAVIYMNGYSITSTDLTRVLVNENNVTLTINGDGHLLNSINGGISNFAEGNLTLNQVNVGTETSSGIAINNSGSATINGGKFASTYIVFMSSGEGTMTITDAEVDVENGKVFYAATNGTIIIEGGTYSSTGSVFSTNQNGRIIVKGGSFSQDPTAYLADGYEAVEIDGMYVVKQR